VPRAELACGRAGDDGDGMAGQPVRPALRLLSGPAACMAASWCTCMARGIIPQRASVVVLAPRVMAHVPVGAEGRLCEAETFRARRRLVVRGGDLSCEAETCRVRRRLVVRCRDFSCEAETSRGGIPLVGNWSEVLPTGRRPDVLPVWVLTGVLSPPRLESWP
jgi:hypothetical protein